MPAAKRRAAEALQPGSYRSAGAATLMCASCVQPPIAGACARPCQGVHQHSAAQTSLSKRQLPEEGAEAVQARASTAQNPARDQVGFEARHPRSS